MSLFPVVFASAAILHAPTRGAFVTDVSVVHAQAPRAVPDSVPRDSSVLLTETMVANMTKFWSRLQQEPDSIRASTQGANTEEYKLFSLETDQGGATWIKKRTVNVNVLATTYPSVAADLTQSGLTTAQWTAGRNALYKAIILGGLSETKENFTAADTSNLGKNIVFLASHANQVNALRATGMWLPDPAQVDGAITRIAQQYMMKQAIADVLLP